MESWLILAETVTLADTLGRLFLAMAAGAVLGWERELQEKPAGLRTHMMVALGSAVFMLATIEYHDAFLKDNTAFPFDPTRTVAGIVGGVGFLGAGSIIYARGSIRGLTTAAGIWVTAALGVSSGMGLYRLTTLSVVLAGTTLWLVRFPEKSLFQNDQNEKSKKG